MKVAVTASSPTMDAFVEPRFGRTAYFVIVDTETMECEGVTNDAASASGGAGIQAAQRVADTGATVVLTGNCGPNAFRTLTAAGIEVVVGVLGMTVRTAVERLKSGELVPTDSANVGSKFGAGI